MNMGNMMQMMQGMGGQGGQSQPGMGGVRISFAFLFFCFFIDSVRPSIISFRTTI